MVQIDQPDSKLKELAYDGFRKRMVTIQYEIYYLIVRE